MKNNKFIFLFDTLLFCIFLFLVFGNFFIGILISESSIKLLNFIALEFFNEERFYVYAKGIGTGLYFFYLICFSFCIVVIYSAFCYGLYSKYKGINFFLIAILSFMVYFFLLCLKFSLYKLATFLLHFPAFWLMYIEIILLYRIRNKF